MSGAINTTGLCTVRDCVALMKADKLTECELTFDLDGEKVNVMVSIIPYSAKANIQPSKYGSLELQSMIIAAAVKQLTNEKLVHDLVAAMKKIRNASDDLSIWYGAIDGREELNTAMDEVDSILAAVGAKEA